MPVLAFEYQIFIDKGLTSLNIGLSYKHLYLSQLLMLVYVSHFVTCASLHKILICYMLQRQKKRNKREQINTFITNLSIPPNIFILLYIFADVFIASQHFVAIKCRKLNIWETTTTTTTSEEKNKFRSRYVTWKNATIFSI